jgi:hypothetical protein
VADVADSDAASRIVNVVQAELQAIASTSGGWAAFTTGSKRFLRTSTEVSTDDSNASLSYGTASYILFASKDGSVVGNYDSAKWTGATQLDKDQGKFFEIVLIRNDTAGYLAYTIRLRWPAFLPNGVRVTDHSQKNVMIVPAAVTR